MEGFGDTAQQIECLPSMLGSLGVIPNTKPNQNSGVVDHVCNPSTQVMETGGSKVQGQLSSGGTHL